MFRKFKSVVVFFKILVTLVLSRPFGKFIYNFTHLHLNSAHFVYETIKFQVQRNICTYRCMNGVLFVCITSWSFNKESQKKDESQSSLKTNHLYLQ